MRIPATWVFLLTMTACAARPGAVQVANQTLKEQEGGLKVFWEARLPVSGAEQLVEGYLRDDALYVTTDQGGLYALQADTGLLRWGERLTEAAYRIYAPSHIQTADDRGPVVIPTTTFISVRDRFSGIETTRFRPEFPPGSSAVGFDGTILIGSSDGRFYSLAYDPSRYPQPIQLWDVATGGPVSASPLLYGGKNLLIASQSGALFACYAPNKQLHWQFKASGPILADPAVDASGVYLASMDRSLYKLDAGTGRQLWRMRFPTPLEEGPVATAQTVYQYSPRQGVTAVDAVTGAEKWRATRATRFVAHSSAGDVLFEPPGRMRIVGHEKGEDISSVDMPGAHTAVANHVNDAVYLLGGGGRVRCLRLDSVPYLRRQQVQMTQEGLNTPPPAIGPAPRPEPSPERRDPARDDPFRSRREPPPATPP